MAFIDWKPEFGVGSPALDQQHKQLIALINQLHSSLLKAAKREEMDRIFAELIRYTESHFTSEEGMLKQAAYPDRSAHQAEHMKFVDEIRALHEKLLSGKYTVSLELLQYLKTWLNDHILVSDQEYAPFLNPVQETVVSKG